MSKVLLILLILSACVPAASAQISRDLLRELLDLPSPPPRAVNPDDRPASFFEIPPPDDAPIEDLLIYWNAIANRNYSGNEKPPSASLKTSLRLIDAIEAEPYKFDGFLKILPVEKEITDRVKLLYDVKSGAEDVSNYWRDEVKEWLKFRSNYFVDELQASAETARDHVEYSQILRSRELQRLAEVDWEKAAPILERLEADKANPRTAVFAKGLFYQRAVTDKNTDQAAKYREELKKIVENKSASGDDRDLAFEALTQNPDWPGFDDWYLSLFADETLRQLELKGNSITAPLTSVTDKNPAKWVPILAGLVGHKNPNVHNAAVEALVEIADKTPSREALLPLLPWLTNPDWANDTGDDRRDFIRSLAKIEIPESIPGLISLVENENDDDAADVLAAFKDQRAVPALRGALSRTPDERGRESFILALINCGGFTDEEMVAAIQTYVETILTPQGYEKVEKRDQWNDENPLPLEISLGKFISKQESPSESFVRNLFESITTLLKTKPAVASKLLEIANRWRGKAVDAELIKRIADGRGDTNAILTVLAKRKELRETVPLELSWLTAKSGLPLAVGIAVFEDETRMASLVFQNQPETQIAALACARLLRIKLPVREVGTLLDSNDKLLALAAERYLESEDSREARELVLSKHKGEALILGARDSFNPAKKVQTRDYSSTSYATWVTPLDGLFASVNGSFLLSDDRFQREFDEAEDKLRKEILENSDLKEIYSTGEYFLRVYQQRAVYVWQLDEAFYYERTLTKEELESFYSTLRESKIDEKSSTISCSSHFCSRSQFVMLNRDGGRRVFTYGEFFRGWFSQSLFGSFGDDQKKPNFWLEKEVAGLEVLLNDDLFSAKMLWKNGNDFRVLVENKYRSEQISEEIDKLNKLDEKNDDLDYKTRLSNSRKRRAEREFEHFEWRKFENGKLGDTVSEPAEIPFLRDNLTFPSVENLDSNDGKRNSRSGNYEIRSGGNFDTYGLWKVNRNEQIKISSGWSKDPVTTPDGKWVVASQTDTNWDNPNYLIRINLQTGKESRIKIAPAKNLKAIAFVSAHQKLLLRSADDYGGYDNAKYYLLDVAAGIVTPVTGVFRPLGHQTYRALQPTGRPNESWAAIYDGEATEIGVYNEREFTFKPRIRLSKIALDSMNIWVDEPEGKIYFIYNGSWGRTSFLMSVPLPAEIKSTKK